MAEKKRHHTVPECYLDGFSEGDYSNAFFKQQYKVVKHINIANLCVESRFYEVNEKYLVKGKEKLDIEDKFFSMGIEPIFKHSISLIEKVIDDMLSRELELAKVNLTLNVRRAIAYLILIQYYRTPRFRALFDNKSAKVKQPYTNKKGELVESIDDPVLLHAFHSFTNKELMKELSYELAKGYWILRYSPNGNFFTSDNPVIVYNNKISEERNLFTIAKMGDPHSIVFFPINHFILLEIFSIEGFPEKAEFNNYIFSVDKSYEDLINGYTFLNGEKTIISYTGDFGILFPQITLEII